MAKIMLLYEIMGPTVLLVKSTIGQIAVGGISLRMVREKNIGKDDFTWCDVVISVRGFSGLAVHIIRMAKKMGKFCMLFIDDDLLNLNRSYFTVKKRKRYLLEILKIVDIVCGYNPNLLAEYLPYTNCKRTARLDSIIHAEGQKPPKEIKSKTENIIILYAANSAHIKYFDEIIRPMLDRLCSIYTNRLKFVFIGVQADMSLYTDRVESVFFETMPMDVYEQFTYSETFHIGLAPLPASDFNEKKHYNKFLEYSRIGIVGIYSNVKPYTSIVKNRINGILCNNTPEDWLFAIQTIIEDESLRLRCVAMAQKQLQEKYSKESVRAYIQKEIPELFSYSAKSEIPPSFVFVKVKYRCFIGIEHIAKIIEFLKNNKLKLLFRHVARYLKIKRAQNII